MSNGGVLDTQLAERVFTGEERWGWQYVLPAPLTPHHLAGSPPVWQEPQDPGLLRTERRTTQQKSTGGAGCGALLVIGLAVFEGLQYAVLLLVILVATVAAPSMRLAAARARARRRREQLWSEYQSRLIHWQHLIAEHSAAHQLYASQVDLWYPLRLESQPSRIDVFGGTADGWASLLATVGGPLLGGGRPLLVMDFSQQSIALELAGLAVQRGVPVNHVPLPAATVTADLMDGFTPEELAESLAEAFGSLRPESAEVDLHSIDVELVETTLRSLEGPVTYRRIAAGMRVLLRIYEPDADGGPLSLREVKALSQAIDLVGQGERIQNELRHIRNLMELLAKAAGVDGADLRPSEWWQPGRLTILATDDPVARRKDLTDRVIFFRMLHHLRQHRSAAGEGTLLIAGADELGRAALESMARRARTAGVRLVLLFEHLREDTVKVAGGSGSATVFMRIGNGHEARDAAQFIGQGYKFLVNQLTRQVGETFTEGRGNSYGEQEGESTSRGSNTGGSFSSGRSWGTSRTFSTSLSRNWQETTNTSTAQSTTHGENVSRVYEFIVEPTQLQELPPTGMVVVEVGPHGRRTVFADCNPGITGLARLSSVPHSSLP